MVAKDKNIDTLNSVLSIVMKSGKTTIGFKETLKNIRNGTSKVIILSSNLPVIRRSQIEYYAMLSKAVVIVFNGSNSDLGNACGKLFRISCMSVIDGGDSDLIEDARKGKYE